MHRSRWIALGLATLGLASIAGAQIDGPTPLAWRWSGPTSVAPSGTPTIDGDNVYVGVGGRVYCVDKTTGNRKWQFPLIEPIAGQFTSTPLIAEGLVIASASDKNIYALDPVKGERKWSYESPTGIMGTPVLAGKFIVFNVEGNQLMAINAADGKPVWQSPERIFDGLMGGLASFGSDVFFYSRSRELWVMKTTTKKAQKLAKFQSLSTDAIPIISGDILYVASGNYVIAMNPTSGSARWQTYVQQPLMFGPAIMPGSVAVGTQTGQLVILDSNGQPKVRKVGEGATAKREPMVVELNSRPIAPPSVVGNLFAIPTVNGALNLVDPNSGELVWSYLIKPLTSGLKASSATATTATGVERGGEIISVPAAGPALISGTTMYLLALDGSLLAFDKALGVDLTGPVVKMAWPAQGSQVGSQKGPLDIFLTITDDATGVNEKTISITINDQAADFKYGRDGFAILRYGSGTKGGVLPDGRTVIKVTATDWMGNKTESSFVLTVDNALAPLALPGGTRPDGGGAGGGATGGGRGGGRSGG